MSRQPRVTIDEIIARRAPERDAKVIARAQRKAALDEEEPLDELETEMMEAVGAGQVDDEDEDDEDEDEDEEASIMQEKVVKGDGLTEDTEEDWLRLGEVSEGEEDDEAPAKIVEVVEDDDEEGERSHLST